MNSCCLQSLLDLHVYAIYWLSAKKALGFRLAAVLQIYSMDWCILPSSPALRSTVHQALCTYVVSVLQETVPHQVPRMASRRFCSILHFRGAMQGFTSFSISLYACVRHLVNRTALWWKSFGGLIWQSRRALRWGLVIEVTWTHFLV